MATAKKTQTKAKARKAASSRARARSNGANAASHGANRAAVRRGEGDTALVDLSAFDDLDAAVQGRTLLDFEARVLLGRVAKLLTTIVAPSLLRRAVGAGYSREEHEELWRLFIAAGGRDQPLSFAFAALDGDGSGDRAALFAELDAFENEWFPKACAIIQRRVPAAHAERFLQGFFRELSQQPLGPLVVDSVATFLDRVEALASSQEPGAELVLATLRSRGLTVTKLSDVRALIARARTGGAPDRPKVDAAAWHEAQARQTDALRELRLAWVDWGTTLRPLYNVPEQIQLGLSEVRVRAEPERGPSPSPSPRPDAPTPA